MSASPSILSSRGGLAGARWAQPGRRPYSSADYGQRLWTCDLDLRLGLGLATWTRSTCRSGADRSQSSPDRDPRRIPRFRFEPTLSIPGAVSFVPLLAPIPAQE